MSFFEHYFDEVEFTGRETTVCCPFPHHTVNGIEYEETRASAHINLDKGVFHCKSCGASHSEVGFIAAVLGCDYKVATALRAKFEENNESIHTWKEFAPINDTVKERCLSLGISNKVIKELEIGNENDNKIAFPVTIFGKLLDVRTYDPGGVVKLKCRKGAMMGLILPFDIWRYSDKSKWTLVCAGEKDMAIARTHGFNAITITGGELKLPTLLKEFEGRKVAICYDNDEAGIHGANQLAAHLFNITKEVRVVTGHYSICKEKGEDITDFFTKYHCTADDLKQIIKNTEPFSHEEVEKQKNIKEPLITLIDATKPQYINKTVRSNIQVVGAFDTSFVAPSSLIAKKVNSSEDIKSNKLLLGQTVEWYLDDTTAADLLKLIDNNFNEEQIRLNTREVLGISRNEYGISISKPTKEAIYKASVIDALEVMEKDHTPIEITAYSLGKKLESGKKYRATYRLVPHPYKGQSLIAIITHVEDSADSVSNFKVTDDVKQSLDVIKNMEGTVEEKVNVLTQKIKGLLDYDGYDQLIQTIDLAYHTVLGFNFNNSKNVRGYLDTFIVSESRVGKSTTAIALQKEYGLGTFTSLAGSSATVAGIIGGSNKVNGTFQTRAGLVPQNHKGLIIFEELAKSKDNILRELTDIKSSNQVRITRVSGTLNLPALVRMITLTNVKSTDGHTKPINSYPNGIEILIELIGSAEDIARFDMILVIGSRGKTIIDKDWKPEQPLPQQVYRDRIRWIWSRTPEQIKISEAVTKYIIEQCNDLNERYDSYIKIFGTEAWKKITRLAIAVAGYTVSTDNSYENIVVTKEHVNFAVNFFINLYDNNTFRFKEYVEEERRYSTIDEQGIKVLQEMYAENPVLLTTLMQSAITSKNNLMAASGLNNEQFGKFLNNLMRQLFIKFKGYDIIPTERFRVGMNSIDKKITITKVGEPDADF